MPRRDCAYRRSSAGPDRSARSLVFAWLLVGLLVVSTAACKAGSGKPTVRLKPDSGSPIEIQVELATDPKSRQFGLMYRTELAANAGMLFLFPKAEPLSFWMKNTQIPLDILYLRDDGSVAQIYANTTPLSEAPLPCRESLRIVLELRGGSAATYGVREGDRIDLGQLATLPSS